MGRTTSTGHDEDGVVFHHARVLEERDLALKIQFEHDGPRVRWFPKSQITDDSEVWKQGDEGDLVVTKWIAREKGLIDD